MKENKNKNNKTKSFEVFLKSFNWTVQIRRFNYCVPHVIAQLIPSCSFRYYLIISVLPTLSADHENILIMS